MADLHEMTKDELLAHAEAEGVAVSSSMTKAEIIAAITGDLGDFTTPRHSITAVTGRDQLTEEQKQALIDNASGAGAETADQSSLGGTGGTLPGEAGP